MFKQVLNLLLRQTDLQPEFKHCAHNELPLLAIDLELTDLNTKVAKITSIAWLGAKMFDVDLASANYSVVRTKGDLQQSPVIHGICAKELASGQHVRDQLDNLRHYTKSHVWVFHNATLDMRVLNKMWKLLSFEPVKVNLIDTMLLQVYLLEKTKGYVPHGSVTLPNARRFFTLSPAPNHNALDDALATMTLLFAQLYHLDKTGLQSLNDLYHTGAIRTFTLG